MTAPARRRYVQNHETTYAGLPVRPAIRDLARESAARQGVSVAEYVSALVTTEAAASGCHSPAEHPVAA